MSTPNGRSLRPNGRKPAALLAFLCYNIGRDISRDQLADLLWSDRGQKQAYDSLRQALYAVRAALGGFADPHLTASRQSIQLHRSAARIDLWHPDGTTNPDLTEPFLSDLDNVSPVFDEWLAATRREVRQKQVAEAERQLADIAEDTEPDRALGCADTILKLDPSNEQAARRAMKLRAARNEMGHVKRLFDNLRTALQSEGLDVSSRTFAVFEDIRKRSDGAIGEASPPAETAIKTTTDVPVIAVSVPDSGQTAGLLLDEFSELLVWRMTQMPEVRVRLLTESGPPAQYDYLLKITELARKSAHNLQLRLESRAGDAVWSYRASFPEAPEDDEIEVAVDTTVTQFLPVLEEHVYRTMNGEPTTAYANYILARRHYIAATDDRYMEQVLSYLHRSVELDPEFLPSIEKLVMHYNTGIFMSRPGMDHKEPRKTAYRFAQQMLFLNSKYPNAHVRMAWCLLWKGNHDSAERSLRKAMELKPYDPHVLNVTGTALVYLGYPDEAAQYYRMSQDRMMHDMDFQRTDYGELHYLNGDFETALSWIETPEVRTPYRTYFWRIPTYAQLGMIPNARKDIEAMLNDLRSRWYGPKAFTPEAAIGWMCAMKPYRRDQDRRLLIDGFNKVGIKITERSFPLIDR